MMASSREALLDAIDKHQDTNAFERAATLAWTQRRCSSATSTSLPLRRPSTSAWRACPLCQSGAAFLVGHDPRGLAGQPVLWAQGISGDKPIVLVRIDEVEDAAVVRELLRAREYWRLKAWSSIW